MDRNQLLKIINNEVMTTHEVVEYLGISKMAVSSLVTRGKLTPLKDDGHVRLFYRKEIEQRKMESKILREKYRPYE